MHYSWTVAIVAIAAKSISALPLNRGGSITADVIGSPADDLVTRSYALDAPDGMIRSVTWRDIPSPSLFCPSKPLLTLCQSQQSPASQQQIRQKSRGRRAYRRRWWYCNLRRPGRCHRSVSRENLSLSKTDSSLWKSPNQRVCSLTTKKNPPVLSMKPTRASHVCLRLRNSFCISTVYWDLRRWIRQFFFFYFPQELSTTMIWTFEISDLNPLGLSFGAYKL